MAILKLYKTDYFKVCKEDRFKLILLCHYVPFLLRRHFLQQLRLFYISAQGHKEKMKLKYFSQICVCAKIYLQSNSTIESGMFTKETYRWLQWNGIEWLRQNGINDLRQSGHLQVQKQLQHEVLKLQGTRRSRESYEDLELHSEERHVRMLSQKDYGSKV